MCIDYIEVLTGIVILAIGSLVLWFIKALFDRCIFIRPRLFLSAFRTSQPSRRPKDGEYIFTWECRCTLKNKSKHTAYDIEIFEVVSKNKQVIFNAADIRNKLPKNNHIDANNSQDFFIAVQCTSNNGSEYSPTRDIRLVVKYRNEKNRVFYTKYHIKKDGQEKSEPCFFKPFRWCYNYNLLNKLPIPK